MLSNKIAVTRFFLKEQFMCMASPNAQRSHAGPLASDWNLDVPPALAGAFCWAEASDWKALLVGSKIPRQQFGNVRFQPSELEIKVLNGFRGIVLRIPPALGFAPQEESLCKNASVPVSAELFERANKLLVASVPMHIEVQ
jgi:hypothetical protein